MSPAGSPTRLGIVAPRGSPRLLRCASRRQVARVGARVRLAALGARPATVQLNAGNGRSRSHVRHVLVVGGGGGSGSAITAASPPTTNANGKAIRSSRRARRGRWLLVEDDHWDLWQDADLEQPGCVAAASAARPPLKARAWPDRRPGGEGVRSATLRTVTRRSTVAAGLRSLSPAVAVVGTRRDGALACRPQQQRGPSRANLLLT